MDAIISFQKVESSRELFNPLPEVKIKRKSLRRVTQLIPGSEKFFLTLTGFLSILIQG